MIKVWFLASSPWKVLLRGFRGSTPTAHSRDGLYRHCCWVWLRLGVWCSRALIDPAAAWLGSLCNGPIGDRLGRKWSMNLAVVVFVIGSALQCGAVNDPMLFVGRAIAGFAVGQLTHIVPLFISEVRDIPFGSWSCSQSLSTNAPVRFRLLRSVVDWSCCSNVSFSDSAVGACSH